MSAPHRLLLDRMRATGGCELQLWSPRRLESSSGLTDLRAFRRSVYEEFGFLGPSHDASACDAADDADRHAFHVLATRRTTGELVGCIRFIVLQPAPSAGVPELVLRNSGCAFSPGDRERCLTALRAYCARWQRHGGPFVHIGGLAVAAGARRSALAPLLCLAGNAFMRACESRFGVVFGAERTSAGGRLYAKAGCAPIAFGDGWLPPLPDLFHRDRAVVLRCDPFLVRADLEPEVEALRVRFRPTCALELGLGRSCAEERDL